MKKEYNITGMTCASCSTRIEKMVGKMDGVSQATVNLATEKMQVCFDQISSQDIMNRVEKLGYDASVGCLSDSERGKSGGMTRPL